MNARRIHIALAVLMAACTTDPPSEPLLPVTEIVISGTPADGVIIPSYTLQLVAEALGPNGLPLNGRTVEWTTTAADIVNVEANGMVQGVTVGSATLGARTDGISATVPLTVREGVIVPASGAAATGTLIGGLLQLSVPPGAATAGSMVHARIATSWTVDDRLVPGTVVELGPNGTNLAASIVAGITFQPATIPMNERADLRVFAYQSTGDWSELAGGSVDLGNSRVNADVMRLGVLGIFRRATPTQLVKLAGDDQVVPRNTTVPISPRVSVRDASGRPVSGIVVTFTTGATGGQLTGSSSSTSGVDGSATISGQWRVGGTAGIYTLIATIPGGITATFSATATP